MKKSTKVLVVMWIVLLVVFAWFTGALMGYHVRSLERDNLGYVVEDIGK